jgi:hypothetical protein
MAGHQILLRAGPVSSRPAAAPGRLAVRASRGRSGLAVAPRPLGRLASVRRGEHRSPTRMPPTIYRGWGARFLGNLS